MSKYLDGETKSTSAMLAHLMKLLPRPALLISEDVRRYMRMLHELAKTLQCKDPMELLMAKDVLDETWTIIRLKNASISTINRRANKLGTLADLRRKRQANEEDKQELAAEVERDIKDEKTRTSAFTEMSEWVYTLTTREKDYEQEIYEANALESSIDYQLKLNILIDAAMKRRNDALKQLEWYRKAFATDLRTASDAAIEAATGHPDAETDADADTNQVSLVPEG